MYVWVRPINSYWMVLFDMFQIWIRKVPFWNTFGLQHAHGFVRNVGMFPPCFYCSPAS